MSLIKEPSDKLFIFKEAHLHMVIENIHVDAQFLFKNLTKLEIMVAHSNFASGQEDKITRTIELFEAVNTNRPGGLEYIGVGLVHGDTPSDQLIGSSRTRINALRLFDINLNRSYERLTELLNGGLTNSQWPRLTELSIGLCGLNHLSPILFELFPQLQNLDLTFIDDGSIEDDVFTKAVNLKQLNLNFNKLILDHRSVSSISTSSVRLKDPFSGLDNLRVLRISNVVIDSFDFFNSLTNLEELDVTADCLLSRVEKFPVALSKLKKLKLIIKQVKCIYSDAFDHLVNLDKFELYCSNELILFETGLAPRFFKCYGIKTVKLNSTEVSKIEEIELDYRQGIVINTQSPLSGLKRLTVTRSHENMSFNEMLNLEFLRLKIGSLSILNSGPLQLLSKLKVLELVFNQSIQGDTCELEGEFFKGLTDLNHLVVNNFTIARLRRGTFTHVPHLEDLDLSNNLIESIEPGAFCYLKKLEILNLSNNGLTEMPFSFLNTEFPCLKKLFISSNNIKSIDDSCFSQTDENAISLRVLDLNGNKLEKLSRKTFSGLLSLVSLKLGSNMLNAVEGGLFNDLINLRHLNMEGNEFYSFDLSELFDSSCYSNMIVMFVDRIFKLEERVSDEDLLAKAEAFFSKFRNRVKVSVNYRKFEKQLLDALANKGLPNLWVL